MTAVSLSELADSTHSGRQRSLIDFAETWSSRTDTPAVIAFDSGKTQTYSYTWLAESTRRLAAGLRAEGVEPGENIGLWADNAAFWIVAWFGIVGAGAVVAPLDPQLAAGDVGRLLSHAGCRRLFTTAERAAQLRGNPATADIETILLDPPDAQATGSRYMEDLLKAEDAALPALNPDAVAALVYTSGTTGTPKGVPLTHANFLTNVEALDSRPLVSAGEGVAIPLPLHHTYPFTVGLLGALSRGATVLFPAGTSGPQLLECLQQGNASVLIGVPRLYDALIRGIEGRLGRPGRLLLSLCRAAQRAGLPLGRPLFRPLRRRLGPHLRLLASGGARLDPDCAESLTALGWLVLSGYGMTEAAPMLTFNMPGHSKLATAGRPIPGVSLRITAAPGVQYGEVQARGANVFSGYWRNPERSRSAFTDDGWLRTGDLGFLDPDGYLVLVARDDEMIVLPSGENVLPEEIEAAHAQDPAIAELAVLQVQGKLVALVVPDAAALRTHGAARLEGSIHDALQVVSDRLPAARRITGFAIARQALPRNALGKLRRFLIPDLYRQAVEGRIEKPARGTLSDADRRLLADPLAASVWDWLQARYPEERLHPDDSPQLDLGIDSLDWTALTLEIQQRFGRTLDEDAVGQIVTLRDFVQQILAAPAAKPTAPTQSTMQRSPRRWYHFLLGAMLYAAIWLAMRVLFRLSVVRRGALPDDACLVTPNHSSYLDPFAIAAALPFGRLLRVHWAGWRNLLYQTAVRRLLSRAAQVFPVAPEKAGLASLSAAKTLLAEGKTVIWFPEGRRSPDGSLQPFSAGAGMLIAESGAPAVPVKVLGSFAALPRDRRWPRLARITVVFGAPLAAETLITRAGGAKDYAAIARVLHDSVDGLEV